MPGFSYGTSQPKQLKFEDLDLSYDALDALDAMHFGECTPIQEKAIPVIQDGRDLIAVAQTGTGKTAAYLLPVIDKIAYGDYDPNYINCLVIAPTRELVQQIDVQMQGFGYYLNVGSAAVYGGTDGKGYEAQKQSLVMGADVVIGTPGRLLAHMSMGYVDLSHVSFLILDEADRMLDMGFFDDIMQIVNALPRERQTLLFSATMPPKIKKLARTILNAPAEVKIAVSKPADNILQESCLCREEQKIPLLAHLLAKKETQLHRAIVFTSSKKNAKELARTLRRRNMQVGEMHSDLTQEQREQVMLDFKAGRVTVLVATDIVARGIDIDDITMVVNYDVPVDPEDYVHRIGRTARAGASGEAVTFVSPRDRRRFGEIERFLGKKINRLELPPQFAGDSDSRNSERSSRNSRDSRNSRGGRNTRKIGNRQKPGLQKPRKPAAPGQDNSSLM